MTAAALALWAALAAAPPAKPAALDPDLLEKRTFADAGGGRLSYRLLKPAAVEPGKTYPLVLFLHGAGERGDDNAAQLTHGVAGFARADRRAKYPCFLAAPQCPAGRVWADWRKTGPQPVTAELKRAVALAEALAKELPVDPKRVYVTGLSMGGFGTWLALAHRPALFAAAAVVCGGGDPGAVAAFAGVPVWACHGARDAVVPAGRSREMVEAIKKAGGAPKYAEYPDVGHDSWVPAYADDGLYAWLFAQKK